MTFKHFTFGSFSPHDLSSETQNTETRDNFDTLTHLLLSSYFLLVLDRQDIYIYMVLASISSQQPAAVPDTSYDSTEQAGDTIAIVLIVINDKSVEH